MLYIAVIRCVEAVCATTDEMLVNGATIGLDRAGIKIPARPSHLYSVLHSSDTSGPKKLISLRYTEFPTGPC